MKPPLVLTLSPNPSVDRVAVVRGFRPGHPVRTVRRFFQSGGSGVHASGVVIELGGATRALVPLGGLNGIRWRTTAEAASIPYDAIEIDGETRSSFVLVDEELGVVAEVIDPGPALGPADADRLLALLERHLAGAGLLVLSGSLPPGVPADLYARAVERARTRGVPALVDAHSEPNRLALAARPWAVKQNLEEFRQLTRQPTRTMTQRLAALHAVRETGIAVMLLTMGPQGLLLATADGGWHLSVPPAGSRQSWSLNTVGCGDALVGAFALEYLLSGDCLGAARHGVAAAHANLATDGVPSCPLESVARALPDVVIRPLG